MEILKYLLLYPLAIWWIISALFFFLAYCIISLRYGTCWFSLFKAVDQTLEFQDRLLTGLRLLCLRIHMKLRIRNRFYMKTVTIYTDGGAAHRAGMRMSRRLAPVGATGGHGQQAPSGGRAI